MTERASLTVGAVAARFALGSLIGVAGLSLTLLSHVPRTLATMLPAITFFLGGAVAGTALRPSVGSALGFGVAFLIGNVGALLSVVATQAMTGREGNVASSYALSYAIVFGIAGFIGLRSAHARGQPLRVGVLGFSGGGIMAALLFVVLLQAQLSRHWGSPIAALWLYATPMTIPWIIGGAVAAKALKAGVI
jgi:hypothetical protein